MNKEAAIAYAQSHDDEPYVYGALDCSGYQSGIYNKLTGKSVRFTTDSDFAALGFVEGYDPNGYSIGTNGGVGKNGHMVGNLYGTNVESGGDGIQYGGSAQNPQEFPMVWHLPQATETGDNPATESLADAPDGATATQGSDVVTGVTDAGVGLSTDGDRVFVTNWPSTLGGNEDEKKPILTAGLKVFANGGIDNLPTQAGIYADGADIVGFAEKGTGGEGYVPMGASKRPRSVQITKEIANRFGYQLVPMADGGLTGFGGWQNDDRPTLDVPLDGRAVSANKQRANFNNALALLAGGANTLLSGFDGKGNFTGKFDTGSNSPAILEEGLSQLLSKLDEIAEAAKNKEPIEATVNIDQGRRTAEIAIMKGGLT